MSAVVILPTTGELEVNDAINSVLNQTYPTICYLICDGEQFKGRTKCIADNYLGHRNFRVCYLPENVGANGFYGHRIYAAFSHLVNEEHVLFLDQDCWFEPTHVEECVNTIKTKNLEWTYSLRRILDKDGNFICNDDCESLGKWPAWTNTNHIDTNTYCVRRDVLIRVAQMWHGGWGQDRKFFSVMNSAFSKWDCTKKYTVNYKLAGNEGSVTKEFFEKGNDVMMKHYGGKLPWKEI